MYEPLQAYDVDNDPCLVTWPATTIAPKTAYLGS
jgi:hypothetical protein